MVAVFTTIFVWGGIALAAFGLVTLVMVVALRFIQKKTQPPPSVVEHRFWAFYQINDRLYNGANKKRLSWSQERFRPHRFRWQSAP